MRPTKNTNKLSGVTRGIGVLSILLLISFRSLAEGNEPVDIFVSISPQKYFVKQVGGDKVEVHVMVGPGQSPQTYEPSSKQMAKLSHAAVYFRMGMPFENIWMDRIKSLNPHLVIIDAREGVKLRNMDQDDILRASPQNGSTGDHGLKDPHIWTNPMNVAIFMKHFSNVLATMYPQDKLFFEDNYQRFAAQLDTLDAQLKTLFQPIKRKFLLVYHPSWGYFTDRYGLAQIPIEVDGKPPNAKALADIIDFAKKNNLHVVFTQKQFSQRNAQAVAKAIGGTALAVDPLAEDYTNNLIEVAQQFAGSMQ
jgi:zinc transport system substrate-binding protein